MAIINSTRNEFQNTHSAMLRQPGWYTHKDKCPKCKTLYRYLSNDKCVKCTKGKTKTEAISIEYDKRLLIDKMLDQAELNKLEREQYAVL